MKKIVAKFKCENLDVNEYNTTVKLVAVNSKDNLSFTKYSPAGSLRISIDKDAPAFGYFIPGKEYYLTFSTELE